MSPHRGTKLNKFIDQPALGGHGSVVASTLACRSGGHGQVTESISY